jgi:hypothetical protein
MDNIIFKNVSPLSSTVVDRHRFDADPDPNKNSYSNADPDPD